jgi:hypothetical protein
MIANRVGHDAVWLAIAGLFCIVEGAVKLTEISPLRLLRTGRAAQGGGPRTRHKAYPTAATSEAPQAFAR